MQLILVTNCSGTKTAEADSQLCARNLPKASIEALAGEWDRRCQSAHSRFVASQLYNGRAFKIAAGAACRARARLFIVSAGFGLVDAETALPSYSLTITPHLDSILNRATKGRAFSASEWWGRPEVHHRPEGSFRSLLKHNPSALLVLATTNPYLQMVADELGTLETELLERIRIVGLKSPHRLPEKLSVLLMPYTNQLNDPRQPIHGTAYDFAARAAAHFIDLVADFRRIHSVEDHREAVHRALAGFAAPNAPTRSNVGDAELRRLIVTFKRDSTSKHKALRSIRDEFGYSCSDERFGLLWSTTE